MVPLPQRGRLICAASRRRGARLQMMFDRTGYHNGGRGGACSSREVRLEQMVVFTAQNLCFVVMGQREEQAPPLPVNRHYFAEEPADKSEFAGKTRGRIALPRRIRAEVKHRPPHEGV